MVLAFAVTFIGLQVALFGLPDKAMTLTPYNSKTQRLSHVYRLKKCAIIPHAESIRPSSRLYPESLLLENEIRLGILQIWKQDATL